MSNITSITPSIIYPNTQITINIVDPNASLQVPQFFFGTNSTDYSNMINSFLTPSPNAIDVSYNYTIPSNTLAGNYYIILLDPYNVQYTPYLITILANNACFLQGSKILCLNDNNEEEYIKIENMQKGTLVKTFKHGYKPVYMIKSKCITNYMNNMNNRNPNSLYLLRTSKYPELFEDLYLTGYHAILVKKISNDEYLKTIQLLNKIFVTDDHYRLLSCIDNKTEQFTTDINQEIIWHFALENENKYTNYGVYATGLLVESCSKRLIEKMI